MSDIYLIGSLRNPSIPNFAAAMRARGADVFDDWYAAGEHADDAWRDYERGRGRDAVSALEGAAARHVFNFDKTHLDAAKAAVLLMPAGTSGHLELGYMLGCGKPGYIVLDGEPERYDVMRCFCTRVFRSVDEFLDGYEPGLVPGPQAFKEPRVTPIEQAVLYSMLNDALHNAEQYDVERYEDLYRALVRP